MGISIPSVDYNSMYIYIYIYIYIYVYIYIYIYLWLGLIGSNGNVYKQCHIFGGKLL